MRIATVGPFGLRVRGTMGRRALPLGRALTRRGHHVTLILPPWDSPADSDRTWEDRGVQIVNVRVGHAGQTAARLLWATLEHHPDVVHVFKPKAYAGLVAQALWYARRTGLWRGRLIIDADDWEGAGGWNERAGYPRLARWLFAWQEMWGFRHADALTVASRWLAAQAHALGSRRVAHVPNGADLGAWPVRPAHASGPPTALLLTRFVEFTPMRLVDIWANVHAGLPDVRLIVTGGALRDEARIAQRLMTTALPEAHVRWLDVVPPDQLPPLCAEADLALFPADANRLNRAKCPARLVDTMAAGLPVVASRVGEHETYVIHQETGLLAPPGDDEALAIAVIALLKDQAQAQQMGKASRQRIATHFTWDRLAETVEGMYLYAVRHNQDSSLR